LAVRPIRYSRLPSVIMTGRTNTSGNAPIATSEKSLGSSLPDSEQGSWMRLDDGSATFD
jgi:hypothetical protein